VISTDQILTYYESRNIKVKPTGNTNLKCPFHDDRDPSLSIHGPTGQWRCHGCGLRGGIVAFEALLKGITPAQAHIEVAKLLGISAKSMPEAVYLYTDARGRILFEKIRFPGKGFKFRVTNRAQVEWNLASVERKPLYNLKQLVTSRYVFIVEGEKACDFLNNALAKAGMAEYCATCNFDGAGKWRVDYSRHLSGKTCVVVADNDGAGRNHAELVATSIEMWAEGVKIVTPGEGDHDGVDDYLATHDLAALLDLVQKTPSILAQKKAKKLFVSAADFMARHTEQPEWLVEGLVQKGGCGMIVAEPGGAKSWLAIDLALALSTGTDFLGHRCSQSRVAFMTREDHPSLTSWRMGQMAKIYPDSGDFLWINSREEMSDFSLTNDEQMSEILNELEKFQPDLIIMDVLNVLHGAEENDNTAMRNVMRQLVNLHERLGRCSIAVLHHESKSNLNRGGSLKKRARGASAIGGWAEWVFAIDIVNADEPDKSQWIRRVEFETKAGAPADGVEFMIQSEGGRTQLKVVNAKPIIPAKPKQESFVQ
jgi:hypothetical protein